MSTVLQKVVDRRKKGDEAAASEWRHLITAVGDDDAKPEKVEAMLAQCGRTLDELTEAVALYRARKAAAATIAGASGLADELPKLRAVIDRAKADMEAAASRFEAVVVPAAERVREIEQQTAAAEAARGRLLAGCPDAEAVRRHQVLTNQLADVVRRRRAAELTVETHSETVAELRGRGPVTPLGGFGQEPAAPIEEEIARCERECEQAKTQLPALRKREADLRRQECNALDEMLRP